MHHAQYNAACLGDDCGYGGGANAHAKHSQKYQVQRYVQNRRKDQIVQRAPAVP